MNLRATSHPEFDAWRWNDYWVPLDVVVEFKRGVYEMALTELARFVPRGEQQRNRYLRGGMRARDLNVKPSATVTTPAHQAPRQQHTTYPILGAAHCAHRGRRWAYP